MVKSWLTCNLAEFVYKKHLNRYCWLQFEEKAGGQSLTRRLTQREEHGTTATGHNFTILTPLACDIHIHCGVQNEKYPVEWAIKQEQVTPGDPAVEAVAAERPSEACVSRHWCLQSPELPGRLCLSRSFLKIKEKKIIAFQDKLQA